MLPKFWKMLITSRRLLSSPLSVQLPIGRWGFPHIKRGAQCWPMYGGGCLAKYAATTFAKTLPSWLDYQVTSVLQ